MTVTHNYSTSYLSNSILLIFGKGLHILIYKSTRWTAVILDLGSALNNPMIIFILIHHIQRYREDMNIHITNTE